MDCDNIQNLKDSLAKSMVNLLDQEFINKIEWQIRDEFDKKYKKQTQSANLVWTILRELISSINFEPETDAAYLAKIFGNLPELKDLFRIKESISKDYPKEIMSFRPQILHTLVYSVPEDDHHNTFIVNKKSMEYFDSILGDGDYYENILDGIDEDNIIVLKYLNVYNEEFNSIEDLKKLFQLLIDDEKITITEFAKYIEAMLPTWRGSWSSSVWVDIYDPSVKSTPVKIKAPLKGPR
ncbi:MAG: hypothetical protein M0R17_03410 [Candidatus Omnitrophica bacterium]|jgi:hypothetical protein|nr:hypothetical protein [Candidatus Omnitrophota bacterium]